MIEFQKIDQKVIYLQLYRGIIVISYRILSNNSTHYTEEELLNELINSEVFRNAFIWDEATENEHGPFSISRIHTNNYKKISHDQLTTEFNALLSDDYFDSPTEEMLSEVNLFLRKIEHSNQFFKLELEISENRLPKPDRSQDHHSYSQIFWEFVEFIAFERPSNLLYMMVFLYE